MESRAGKACAAAVVIAAYALVLSSLPPAAAPRRPAGDIAAEMRGINRLIDEKRFADALEPASRLHGDYPANHVYMGQLAEIYRGLGRFRDEAAMWEQYLLYAPRPIEACPAIGKAYENQNRMADAISAYERCLTFEEDVDTLAALGHVFELDGKLDKALERYRQGLRRSPGNADIELGLARIALRRGTTAEAAERARQVMKTHPDYADGMLVMGMVAWRQGKGPEAKRWLSAGYRRSPTDPDFPAFLGRIAEAERDYPDALRYYKRAVELAPSYREVVELRNRLREKIR